MSNHYAMCKYDDATGTYIPLEVRPYIDDFQAGAASRDAYIEQLELALLQVRKALCGDIHNTDDLLDLIERLQSERNQLRAHINVLLKALQLTQDQAIRGRTFPATASPSAWFNAVTIALASTTEQSLTDYRNKVIEAFVNEFSRHVGGDGEFWLHELQDFAMKEQP